jgi:hypothetical protein
MQTQTYRMRSTPRPIPTNSASCVLCLGTQTEYSRRCRDCGKKGDSGRSPTLGPCVQENAAQEDRED